MDPPRPHATSSTMPLTISEVSRAGRLHERRQSISVTHAASANSWMHAAVVIFLIVFPRQTATTTPQSFVTISTPCSTTFNPTWGDRYASADRLDDTGPTTQGQ